MGEEEKLRGALAEILKRMEKLREFYNAGVFTREDVFARLDGIEQIATKALSNEGYIVQDHPVDLTKKK